MSEAYESTTTYLRAQPPCALVQDLLPLYLEGEVSGESRDMIVQHLALCERCAGFLAGAQSVRGQLRRENQQRVEVLQSQPHTTKTLAWWMQILMAVAILPLCGIGGLGGGLFLRRLRDLPWGFWGWGTLSSELVVGAVLVGTALTGLMFLASLHKPLSSSRLLALCTACSFGALGTSMIFDNSGWPGVLLSLVSLVWVYIVVLAQEHVWQQVTARFGVKA